MRTLQVITFILANIILCQCSKSSDEMMMDTDDPMPGDSITPYRYLALGDSYTIGTNEALALNFPNQLIDSLASRHYESQNSRIIATNGWTTSNLLTGINAADIDDKTYDFVTLLIGVNNQYQNIPITVFETQFDQLLDKAIMLVDGDQDKVIVLSIPDYSVTPFVAPSAKAGVAAAIAEYNSLKKQITESKNVKFVDITPISRLAADDESLLAPDLLHPSAKMYSLWVHKILDEVLAIL